MILGLFLLLALSASDLLALSASDLVALSVSDSSGAEAAYRAGRYAEALALYEQQLGEPGFSQGALYYDLGNCAFRLGDFPRAILLYRRAELRLPRDPDVPFNRRLCERRLGIESPARRAGPSNAAAALDLVDARPPVWRLAIVTALEMLGLAGLLFLRGRGARVAAVLVLALALAGAGRLLGAPGLRRLPLGVVLAEAVALRPEPQPDGPTTLELGAGQTVRVLGRDGNWIRVDHPRGRGWTERAGVGRVD